MSTPESLNGRPLPPGWVPHYDEQGNVWFDIQRDDEDSYQSQNRSVPRTPSPPAMAAASPQKPLSFAQKLYASALPPKYSDQQSSSQDPTGSSRPTPIVHSENATVSNSSDTRLPPPHRAQTHQPSPAPPRIPENHRHQRASTYSAPTSSLTDVRTVSLIARRPDSSGEFKGYSTPNPTAAPSYPPQHNPSLSAPPLRPPITHYRTAPASIPAPPPPPPLHVPSPPTISSRPPIVHYPTTPSLAHASAPHASPPTSAVNTSFQIPSPPHSSPSTITRFPQSPPETQRQLPHLPPTQAGSYQGTPPASTVSDRSLLTDVGKIAGKAALKYVGSAALNSLTSGVLSGDALSGLSTIFQGLNVGDALGSFDISQLQGIVQGQSGADYQSIIDAITQQAPQQAPGVDYQSIINELANLQLNQSYQPAASPSVDYQAQLQVITQQAQANYQDTMNANMQQLQDIMSMSQQQQQQTYNPMQDILQMQQQQEQQSMQMLQALQQQQQQATQQMGSALQQQNPFSFSNSGGSSQQSAPPPPHQSTHPYAGQHSQHHNAPVSPSGHPYQHSHGYGHHAQPIHSHPHSGHHTGHRF